MLCLAKDELSNADAARRFDCFAKQRVRVIAVFAGHEVVGRFKVAVVDPLRIHERHDLDGLGLLERRRAEVFLAEDDEPALLVLVTLDEIVPRHRMTFLDAHAVHPYRRQIFLVQHPEARPMIADRAVHLDRDADETERERALPERTRHQWRSSLRASSSGSSSSGPEVMASASASMASRCA